MKNIQFFTFNVIFEKEDDNGYCVQVPALQGCFSQGDSFEEAVENIKEAINLYLEETPGEEREYWGQRAEREFVVPIKVEQYA